SCDNIARIKRDNAGYVLELLCPARAWTGARLPGAVDVDGEADQAGIGQGERLTDHPPQPVCRLKNMQCGFDTSTGRAGVGWHKRCVAVKANDIAYRAGRAVIGMIDIRLRVLQESGNSFECVLAVIIAVLAGPAAYNRHTHVSSGRTAFKHLPFTNVPNDP